MMHNDFFDLFCERFFDDNVNKELFKVIDKVDSSSGVSDRYREIIDYFMYPQASGIKEVVNMLMVLSKDMDVNDYTLNTVFFISCSEILRERFKEAELSDELFWDTIADIKYKTYECIFCKDTVGIFVPEWFGSIFSMELLQFGRFQFHKVEFPMDFTTRSGKRLHKGQEIFNMHIPAGGGPLTREDCIKSFKLAYEFYKDDFEGDIMVIKCGSWMLNPDHPKFLPEGMNILTFMEMFDLYETYITENYLEIEGCRFFGNCFGMTYEELPENTRLQRAYKKYLLEGNKPVNGRGVVLFDGEKIVN